VVTDRRAEAVLLTGVYGSGKSSVAAGIAYLLERQGRASDVTSGRRDDLREAAASIATAEGAGCEDITISNDRPIAVVAQELMTFLGWLRAVS
jgi:adenylylsulfate kinase-like enzyme